MATRTQPRVPQPRVTGGTAVAPAPACAADAPWAALTEDEHAELVRLRAEKAQLQNRVHDLNMELTLVKAAAALFVGEHGRLGPRHLAAPEVA